MRFRQERFGERERKKPRANEHGPDSNQGPFRRDWALLGSVSSNFLVPCIDTRAAQWCCVALQKSSSNPINSLNTRKHPGHTSASLQERRIIYFSPHLSAFEAFHTSPYYAPLCYSPNVVIKVNKQEVWFDMETRTTNLHLLLQHGII